MKDINNLIEQIKEDIKNLKKTPGRIYTAPYILKKVNELKEIKSKFIEKYVVLLENDAKLACKLKEQFDEVYRTLDKIIEEKIVKTLEKESRTIKNMATFDITVTLKVVPEFQGDPKNLNNFLNLVEFLHDDLKDNTEKTKLIKFVLKTRLSEKVKNKLSASDTPTDLVTLKSSLQGIFKVNKTPLKIQSELAKAVQGSRPIKDFAEHVENLVAQLNALQIAEQGEAHRGIISKLNDQIGLNAFKNGLQEGIKSTVFASTPKTLQDAVKIASEVETIGTARVFNYNSRRFNNFSQNRFRNNNNFQSTGTRHYVNQRPQYRNSINNNNNGYRTNFGNNRRGNFNNRGNNNNRRGNFRINVVDSGNEQIPEESGES